MNQHSQTTEAGNAIVPVAPSRERRYDVDTLRVFALSLLIIYHIVVSYQPWARFIFFIESEQSVEALWILMSMINVWRIPILFMISGMGVRFAMERRDWKELLKDRTIRILVPFVFGFFVISPIFIYIALAYYGFTPEYVPNAGHLWFLGFIFVYVLVLLPLLVQLKNRQDHPVVRFMKKIISWPGGLFLFAIPLMLEASIVNPDFFETYAMTPHGFWLGMLCFLTGFLFVSMKDAFWSAVARIRIAALLLAFSLYLVRLLVFELEGVPVWLVGFESMSWMLGILGFASLYLNKPSKWLAYFSKAVYPVYIIHMPVQFLIAYYLFPLNLPVAFELAILLVGTFAICLMFYEFVLKRLKWIRPLFGMKLSGGWHSKNQR